jgi:hypothetical protein
MTTPADPSLQTPVRAPITRSNKRRSRRQSPKGSTRVRAYRNALGLGPNISAGVLDVSETGVRLLLKETLPIGQEFEVILESVAGSGFVKVIAKVIWVVKTADGQFCTGSEFTKSLSYANLQKLARV